MFGLIRNSLLLLALLICANAKGAVEISVLDPQVGEAERQAYLEHILLSALQQAKGKYADASVVHMPYTDAARGGMIRLILQGIIDVYWTATSRERERKMLPVKLPLMQGLLGY